MSSFPSTSYDRFWEGRKSFAGVVSIARNMSRMIWVNVGPQASQTPAEPPVNSKVKMDLQAALRRRKVDALHLCLSFVFATKHYLRDEDGLNYPDYLGVLPPSFARLAGKAMDNYQATRSSSVAASHEGGLSGTATPDFNKSDATKRVRAKRSKQQLTNSSTPLLHDRRSADFYLFSDEASLPVPLMYVSQVVASFGCADAFDVVLLMS